MLVGWVSDERYLALAGVDVEIERDGELVAQVRSSASGRVVADVPAGEYRIGLARDGFGSKWVDARLGPGRAADRACGSSPTHRSASSGHVGSEPASRPSCASMRSSRIA